MTKLLPDHFRSSNKVFLARFELATYPFLPGTRGIVVGERRKTSHISGGRGCTYRPNLKPHFVTPPPLHSNVFTHTGGGGILYGDFSAGENSAWGKFRTCPKNQGENSAPPKSAVHWKQKGSWDCDPQKILGEGNDHCA